MGAPENAKTQGGVVTVGEALVVLDARPGESLAYASSFARRVAGAESNVAIALSRLGIESCWIGRIGADPLGDAVLTAMRGEKVDTRFVVRDPAAPTGLLFREHVGPEASTYYVRSGSAGSRLLPEDLSAAAFAGRSVLHLSGITPALSPQGVDTVMEAIRLGREHDLAVSFDPNLRFRLWSPVSARAVLRPIIAQCDIVLPSVTEAAHLTGEEDPESAAKSLLDLGAKLVVLKLGPDGALAATRRLQAFSNGTAVANVVDATGAGDAFAAGLLYGLSDAGWPVADAIGQELLSRILTAACTMGAAATQFYGDWEGLPTRELLDSLISKEEIHHR